MASVNGVSPASPAILSSIAAWRDRAKRSRPIVQVAIPEFDLPGEPPAVVLMRAMPASQKEDWSIRTFANEAYEPDAELRKARDRQKTWAEIVKGTKVALVATAICDEQGQPLFSAAEVAEISEANAAALERLYAKAVQLNGLDRANIPDYLKAWLEADEHPAPSQQDLEARVRDFPSGPSADFSSV